MTSEDIDKLKGKLVSVTNPYRSRPFLGRIYRVKDDLCWMIDGTGNQVRVQYEKTDSMREATGEEAIAQILSDCKCCITDMNIDTNF